MRQVFLALVLALAVGVVTAAHDTHRLGVRNGGKSLSPLPDVPAAKKEPRGYAAGDIIGLALTPVTAVVKQPFVLTKKAIDAIGPQPLLTSNMEGVLVGPKRTFMSETTWDIDSVNLEVETRGGKCNFIVSKFKGVDQTLNTNENKDDEGEQIMEKLVEKDNKETLTVSGIQDWKLRVVVKKAGLTCSWRMRLTRPNMGKVWTPNRALSTTEKKKICGYADLHAHQFADLGFGGNFILQSHDGPMDDDTKNLDWQPKVPHPKQQIHAEHVKMAHIDGLNVLVATAVNNQAICLNKPLRKLVVGGDKVGLKYSCKDMSSVKRQVRAVQEFAKKHSDWYAIAHDPWEARRIVHSGKIAVIVSVEVSNFLTKSWGEWKDQVHELYDMGVRMMQLVHQTNNDFAGAAPHQVPLELLQYFKSNTPFILDKNNRNVKGLTSKGKELVKEMMRLNMLIDVAHLSKNAVDAVYRIVKEHSPMPYPFLYSHCRFEKLLYPFTKKIVKEFVCDDRVMQYVKDLKGIIGMRNGPEAMHTFTPKTGSKFAAVPNTCDGSSLSQAQSNQYGAEFGVDLAWGGDMNGFALQTTPRFGKYACYGANRDLKDNKKNADEVAAKREAQAKTQTKKLGTDFDTKGVSSQNMLGDLMRDMALFGADISSVSHSAENVLRMWARNYGVADLSASATEAPDTQEEMKCAADNYLPAGHTSTPSQSSTPSTVSSNVGKILS